MRPRYNYVNAIDLSRNDIKLSAEKLILHEIISVQSDACKISRLHLPSSRERSYIKAQAESTK